MNASTIHFANLSAPGPLFHTVPSCPPAPRHVATGMLPRSGGCQRLLQTRNTVLGKAVPHRFNQVRDRSNAFKAGNHKTCRTTNVDGDTLRDTRVLLNEPHRALHAPDGRAKRLPAQHELARGRAAWHARVFSVGHARTRQHVHFRRFSSSGRAAALAAHDSPARMVGEISAWQSPCAACAAESAAAATVLRGHR